MKKFIILTFICLLSESYCQNSFRFFDNDTLDINNISLSSYNVGNADRGFWKILNDDPLYHQTIIFDHGPWIVGKIENDTVLSLSQWYPGYSPGPIINGQAAMLIHPEDSLKYRVYKVSIGDDSTNIDYADWPVEFGAPVDNDGNPLIHGDQTLWTAFNAQDSTVSNAWWFESLEPFPIELHQTVFAREGFGNDEQDIFANVIFIEWEIINKGNLQIDSTFFGFWTDIDFEDLYDNRPGVDTQRQLGYCWTNNTVTPYDSIPPAVGYCLLYGPVVPSIGSTATFKGRYLSNYKNLNLSSYHGIIDDSDPRPLYTPARSLSDAWNIARGFDSQGNIIIDPTTNNETKFPLSGNPVTGNGWIYESGTGGGAGFVFFSGPFTIAPNDTQWAMIAIIPGLGTNNLNSITQMRKKADILSSLPYDSLAFGSLNYPVTDIEDDGIIPYPKKYSLQQNFPNPFNPSTVISYQIPQQGFVTLKIFDVLGREVATLVNEEKPAGKYDVDFSAKSLSSGVYIYRMKVNDFITSKKMILLR